MTELALAIIGDSAAAPAAHILEGLTNDLANRHTHGVPHTIYQELWHLAFWQAITLDWVRDIETPFPARPSDGFDPPTGPDVESLDHLTDRFLHDAGRLAAIADDLTRLDHPVRCPSRPGQHTRTMSVRDQLESLAVHNAYHLARIVLLRQLSGAWPPASGGFTW